jgi:multisubunit Na+/H+ antiporter MnhB subunit
MLYLCIKIYISPVLGNEFGDPGLALLGFIIIILTVFLFRYLNKKDIQRKIVTNTDNIMDTRDVLGLEKQSLPETEIKPITTLSKAIDWRIILIAVIAFIWFFTMYSNKPEIFEEPSIYSPIFHYDNYEIYFEQANEQFLE